MISIQWAIKQVRLLLCRIEYPPYIQYQSVLPCGAIRTSCVAGIQPLTLIYSEGNYK